MKYSLTINISPTSVQNINNANQTITACKVINSFVSSASAMLDQSAVTPTVAWLAFAPFQRNVVDWEDTYSVYATDTPIMTGRTISINSTMPATLGLIYTLSSGTFTATPYQYGASTFNIANQQSPGSHSFGLMQQATINGANQINTPVNCVPVLYNQQAMFTPSETVYIFLSSCTTGGSFIPILPSSALAVTLSAQNPSTTLGFNDATNLFYIT